MRTAPQAEDEGQPKRQRTEPAAEEPSAPASASAPAAAAAPAPGTKRQKGRKGKAKNAGKDGQNKGKGKGKGRKGKGKEKGDAKKKAAEPAPVPTIPCEYCGELFSSRTKLFKHLRAGGTECTRKAMAEGLEVPDKDKVQKSVLVVSVCSRAGLDAEAALRTAVAAGGAMPASAPQHNAVVAVVPLASGGEHAGCTVISMHVPKVRLANDAYAAQLNAALPAEVRVVAVDSVLSDFDAGAYCTKLVYEALVPLPLLLSKPDDLDRGFASCRFERHEIVAPLWQERLRESDGQARRLLYTHSFGEHQPPSGGCLLGGDSFVEWAQERAQVPPDVLMDARIALQLDDGRWIVNRKNLFAKNAVSSLGGEGGRSYDLNWLSLFHNHFNHWLPLDSETLTSAVGDGTAIGGEGLRVVAYGMWQQRPSDWTGAEYTLGHYRLVHHAGGKPPQGSGQGESRTRLEINTALKDTLNTFVESTRGLACLHNFTSSKNDEDKKSVFAPSEDREVWKATCAGNLLFVPEAEGGADRVSDAQEFVRLRFEGKKFLRGQVAHMAALAVHATRNPGAVTPELIRDAFGPSCPLPIDPLPASLVYVSEASYIKYETTNRTAVWPRDKDFPNGFNSARHELAVRSARAEVQAYIATAEASSGDAGRWLQRADGAANRLAEAHALYRATAGSPRWCGDAGSGGPAPAAYEKVLGMLRQISAEQWPRTSNARRERILDKGEESSEPAEMGEFAPSGDSFTLGAMPKKLGRTGGEGRQPAANATFGELLEACLDLEAAIMPERLPSSTVVINRNAQFRPHTDSGAGAGQSCSLIVGLGDYVGGGLAVEGKMNHIRYQPLEFDGWKQVHWTLPFEGERFSIVWFTPLGCEEVAASRGKPRAPFNPRAAWAGATGCKSLELKQGCQPGQRLPALGLGTHTLKGDAARDAVGHALAAGYRCIDTAAVYQNEEQVGAAALSASGVVRDEVFLTSKLKPQDQGYDAAHAALDESLDALGTDYLDLCKRRPFFFRFRSSATR